MRVISSHSVQNSVGLLKGSTHKLLYDVIDQRKTTEEDASCLALRYERRMTQRDTHSASFLFFLLQTPLTSFIAYFLWQKCLSWSRSFLYEKKCCTSHEFFSSLFIHDYRHQIFMLVSFLRSWFSCSTLFSSFSSLSRISLLEESSSRDEVVWRDAFLDITLVSWMHFRCIRLYILHSDKKGGRSCSLVKKSLLTNGLLESLLQVLLSHFLYACCCCRNHETTL